MRWQEPLAIAWLFVAAGFLQTRAHSDSTLRSRMLLQELGSAASADKIVVQVVGVRNMNAPAVLRKRFPEAKRMMVVQARKTARLISVG